MPDKIQLLSDNFANALLDLCRSGQTELVRETLKTVPSRNIIDADGNTPLHLAVKSGNLSLVELLLQKGFDPTIKNKNGYTPIAVASSSRIGNKWSCVCLFLRYKKENQSAQIYGLDASLIHAVIADNLEMAKVLLQNGARCSQMTLNKNNSCLHIAVLNNNSEMVELLLHHGANVNAKNKEGKTPLTLASSLASQEKQSWNCYQTILKVEISKRHGTKPAASFDQLKQAANRCLNEYCNSMFMHNWEFIRHRERAASFQKQLNSIKSIDKMIELLRYEVNIFNIPQKNILMEETPTAKYKQLPQNRKKDAFNHIVEDFLDLFERLNEREAIREENLQNGFRQLPYARPETPERKVILEVKYPIEVRLPLKEPISEEKHAVRKASSTSTSIVTPTLSERFQNLNLSHASGITHFKPENARESKHSLKNKPELIIQIDQEERQRRQRK